MPKVPRYITHIVLPYALFAALWMFLSDRLVETLVTDFDLLAWLQTYKDLAFVAVTSLLLYGLLRREKAHRERFKIEQTRLRNRILGILENISDGFVALDRDWNYQYINRRAGEFLGREPGDLIGKNIWEEFPEGVNQNFYHAYQRVMRTQQPETIEEFYPPWQRWFENRISPAPEGLHIFFQEITTRKQAELWREGQGRVLERIVAEHPLTEVLETLIYVIESQATNALGSVMLLDADGQHLHYGAGPSLPVGLGPALEGMEIGSSAGACGTAAYTRDLVIIEDFQTDPRGVDYRALAAQLNLHACWSQPIFSASGQVLGTFAMYYTEVRAPSVSERRLIAEAGHLAAVAIEAARNRSALLASETRFRATFEQAAVGIAHVSPEGKFLRINQKFCDIAGYPLGELLTLTFQEITHPDDLDADLNQVKRVLAGEIEIYSVEKRYRRKDGEFIWVNLTVSLVHKDDASPDYFIAVIEDIRERKQTEAALSQSEEHFRSIFEQAMDGILIADAQAQFLDVNNTVCQMLGYSREDLLQLNVTDIIGAEELPLLEPALKNLKEQGQVRSEWRLRRRDGSMLLAEVSSKVLTDGRLQGFVRDITEYRKAQAALLEREEILRLFVQHSPAAIGMLDTEMRYVVASRRWLSDYTLHDQDIIGRSHYAVFPEISPHWRAIHQRCLAGATERCDEDRLVRADGRIDWVKWEICPWHKADDSIGGIVIFSEIVTEQKRATLKIAEDAKSLARLSRQLLAAQETERRHIARELHDEVGQLLTVVKLDLQTVLRQEQPQTLNASVREGMESIDRVISRVRDLSLDLRPSMLDDFGLVPALRWLVQRQAKHLGANIDLDLPVDPPRLPTEVETACFRIVQEALTNVLRHAKAKSIQVAMHLHAHNLEITIKDDGKGFDLIALRSPEYPGTGFGMLGMRERAELAGGEFDMVAAPGQGCCVIARFPLPAAVDPTRKT